MKKSLLLSSLMLFAAAIVLSGCIVPYWDDVGRGGHPGRGHHRGNR